MPVHRFTTPRGALCRLPGVSNDRGSEVAEVAEVAMAKGTVLIGAVKYLRSRKEDSAKILPDDLQHYLSKRLSPALWYPEEDSLQLIKALVQLMPGDPESVLEQLGLMRARALGKGIYSHLVKDGGTDSSTRALWASMHDTGDLTIVSEKDHVLLFRLSGYANPCHEMCVIVGSYIQETLRMGGRFAKVTKVDCALSGSEACTWRADWSL